MKSKESLTPSNAEQPGSSSVPRSTKQNSSVTSLVTKSELKTRLSKEYDADQVKLFLKAAEMFQDF